MGSGSPLGLKCPLPGKLACSSYHFHGLHQVCFGLKKGISKKSFLLYGIKKLTLMGALIFFGWVSGNHVSECGMYVGISDMSQFCL